MSLQESLRCEPDTCAACCGEGTINLLRCECGSIAIPVKDGKELITERFDNHKKKVVEYLEKEGKCSDCGLVDLFYEEAEQCESCNGRGWL